ncbi:expressed unknown protein [Seminavis robusta]|uniref:RING-type domain-containing protein n=1 Tax=Seminavis robusta TaxID=568900 RepID=A0A9N8D809_9STRA|nr:expressed unknown protein [Seminavis robusta]|eukprot:Sro31_g020480.1 n/a (473) ;mRNA; f:139070-140488
MTEGNCCICLESLFSESDALGVTVPCGHPIHENCFRGWEASIFGKGYGRSYVKCPSCNAGSASFMKVFISLPASLNLDEDDDDDDDSSVDTNMEGEEEGSGEADKLAGDDSKKPEEEEKSDDDEKVVDLTASPPPKEIIERRQSSSSGGGSDEQTTALKRRLKKYKLQYKQCHSNFQECTKKQKEILDRHQTMKKDLEKAQQDVKEIKQASADREMELSHKSYEVTRLRRERDDARRQLAKAQEEFHQMRDAFEKEKSQYAQRLHQAQQHRSVETKKIMNDNKELRVQLEETKRKLEHKEKFCAKILAKLQELEPKYKEDLMRVAEEAETGQDSRKKRKKTVEMLRQMSKKQEALNAQKVQRDETLQADRRIQKVASGRARQMVNAATLQANRKPKAKQSALDSILGSKAAAPASSSDHKNRTSESATEAPAFHLSTTAKRKHTINRRTTAFGLPKKGGNGDIRSMLRHSSV